MSRKRFGDLVAAPPAPTWVFELRLRLSMADTEALRRYAEHLGGVHLEDAGSILFDAGLRAHERARTAGLARAARRTPAEQRAAADARWKKKTPPKRRV